MTYKNKNIVLLLLSFLLSVCSQNGAYIKPNQPLKLPDGKAARVSDKLVITFEKVLGDSRCPSDVTCIHQGEATVLVRITQKDKPIGNFELTALNQNTAVAALEGYTLHLEKLMPWPLSTKDIMHEEYIAVFKIEKTAEK